MKDLQKSNSTERRGLRNYVELFILTFLLAFVLSWAIQPKQISKKEDQEITKALIPMGINPLLIDTKLTSPPVKG